MSEFDKAYMLLILVNRKLAVNGDRQGLVLTMGTHTFGLAYYDGPGEIGTWYMMPRMTLESVIEKLELALLSDDVLSEILAVKSMPDLDDLTF